jgi:hypothetical protein
MGKGMGSPFATLHQPLPVTRVDGFLIEFRGPVGSGFGTLFTTTGPRPVGPPYQNLPTTN